MKKYLYVMTGALLLAAGCTKEMSDPRGDAPLGRVSTVSASMPATRAVFEGDKTMLWQEGDQIGLYVYSTTKDNSSEYTPWIAPYSLSTGAGEAKATFTHIFEDESLGETFGNVAIYPYADGSAYHFADDGGTLDLMLPMAYSLSSLSDLERVNMPMVAVLDMSEGGDKESLYFKHVGGAVKVTINGLSSKDIAWVELRTGDQRVNGLFSVDLTAGSVPVAVTEPAQVDDSDWNVFNNQRRVLISWPESLELPDPVTFYFPVPTGTYDTFSISAYDRHYSLAFDKAAVGHTISRGTILQMPAFDAPSIPEPSVWSVIGEISESSLWWATDYDMTETSSGIWQLENVQIAAGNRFKVRGDHDWSSNYGGVATGEDENQESVCTLTLGQPADLDWFGANFQVTEDGFYTITLNLNTRTLTVEAGVDPYAAFTLSSPWSITGAIASKEMSWNYDILMTSDGTWSLAQGVALTDADQFKFRKDLSWDINYGGDNDINPFVVPVSSPDGLPLYTDGSNLAVGIDGMYDIFFHEEFHLIRIVPSRGGTHTTTPKPEPEPVIPFEGWSVIGDICNTNWDTDFDMTTEDQIVFTSSPLAINAGEIFKIRYGHDWDVNRGPETDAPVTVGEPFNVVEGGPNITLTESGTYIIIYDSQAEQITIAPAQPAAPSWGVVGSMTGWGSDPDIPMVEDPNIPGLFAADNVSLSAEDSFKIRANSSWDLDYGGTFQDFGYTFAAVKAGLDITVGKSGVYSILLDLTNPASPLIAVLESPSSAPSITIDGDMSDWANVEGVSNGSHGMFKVASDADNLYFYTWRTTEGRFSDLWGAGVGYVYFAFDLDGNADNGVTLLSNGPYDYIGYIYCFGGSASNPVIEITASGDCAPDNYTVANVQVKGYVDANGAYLEYSIPRADLPAIPSTPVTVTSWGNKDLARVSITVTL